IEVVGGPTVREADGLAMSSRNARLDAAAREAALCVPEALDAMRAALARGERDVEALQAAFAARIAEEPRARLEYATVCDPDSLEPVARVEAPAQVAVAVWIGSVRLIDNVRLDPACTAPEPIARNPRNASPSRTATLPESAEAR
ncbi:MAG: pantoate--beta-alanine ligase, partial [Alphaproteobacteria bacterium]